MSGACSDCGGPVYRYSKTGRCKACSNRARVPDAVSARLAMLKTRSNSERLDKFRVKHGEDECWGWAGGDNGVGYPVLRINKVLRVATQIALEADGRPKPSPDHVACHACDNPPCTNPKHLWWGTETENMQDAASKGRLPGNKKPRLRGLGAPIKGALQ